MAGAAVLDLDYAEDSHAEADANFVLTGAGGIVEIQATAEHEAFAEARSPSCWRWPGSASASCCCCSAACSGSA